MFAFDKVTLLLCLLGGTHWVLGDDVEIKWAEASKQDKRDRTDSGCGPVGGEGCSASNTYDGLLNDVPDSRWSCHDEDIGETPSPCFITWELPNLHSLDDITIYFYKSDDPDRHTNEFNLSTSTDGATFNDVADGLASIIPTDLGEGNTYDLSASGSAVFIRMTGTNSDQDWLSVCETQICGTPVSAGPTPVTTSAPMDNGTGSPTQTDDGTGSPTQTDGGTGFPTPTPLPTASGSVFTPSPSISPVPSTRSPVATPGTTSSGAIATSATNSDGGRGNDGDDDDGDSDGDGRTQTAIIVGCVCGGVALLVLVGLGIGYRARTSRSRTPAPPPPPYDVVSGKATAAIARP